MRRKPSLLTLALAALLLAGVPLCAHAKRHVAPAPAPQMAAEPVGVPDGEEAPPQEAKAEPGLPQLDPRWIPGQAFWLVIAFALTYGLMRYLALPGVEQTLQKRQAALEADLSAAKRMNEEAKTLAADADKRMNAARADAQEHMSKAGAENTAKLSAAIAEQQKKLDEHLKTAESRLTAQKQQALVSLDAEATGMIEAILKRVAGISPPADQAQAAWRKAKEA